MPRLKLTGNKGEWSELYVFLKLLSDNKLYGADAELNKISDIYYNVLKILRGDSGEDIEYCTGTKIIIKRMTGEILLEVPMEEFKNQSSLLLAKIKSGTGPSFSYEEARTFLEKIKISKIKSKSLLKRDITIIVHDPNYGNNPQLGFSIKSQLGNPSTLLNSGKTTNFIYKISGTIFSPSQISEINGIKGICNRLAKIKELGGFLGYFDMREDIFKSNLQVIDCQFPLAVSNIVKTYYEESVSSIKDLTMKLSADNPCDFDQTLSHKFYEINMKNLLVSSALGMLPSVIWNDEYEATGGYIIVKEDGEILCYHVYNREKFREYLFGNTKLETGDSGRNDFGKIYKNGNKFFINLNLQIRFIM